MKVNQKTCNHLNESPLYAESGIYIAPHSDSSIVNNMAELVQSNFTDTDENYASMDLSEYRQNVLELQEKLCELEYNRKIAETIQDHIRQELDEEDFFIQTNTYLRAARPLTVNPEIEAIGWHRETFYGPNMEKSYNIWTPILNVSDENTLRFIPKSQLIPDNKIKTSQHDEETTPKGSASHKIGYQYSPKKIVSGVDLNHSEKMIVPNNCSSIFPGNLIHGAGTNLDRKIRFSTDFRILPKSAYDIKKNKQFHLSSEKPYFELF
tara:strand:+ start:19142 stop:19936 length:795 start_codon:yes stop_codon:yes gene_type:complete